MTHAPRHRATDPGPSPRGRHARGGAGASARWRTISPRSATGSPSSDSASIPRHCSGFPILGAGIGAAALLALPLLTLPAVPAWGALAVWWSSLPPPSASPPASPPAGSRWEAREDANLIAVRSDGPVRRWIVAHLDTKAQGQSMAGRLVAVWVLAAAIAVDRRARRRLGSGARFPLWLGAAGAGLAVVAGALAGQGAAPGHLAGARETTGAGWSPRWPSPRRRPTRRPAS